MPYSLSKEILLQAEGTEDSDSRKRRSSDDLGACLSADVDCDQVRVNLASVGLAALHHSKERRDSIESLTLQALLDMRQIMRRNTNALPANMTCQQNCTYEDNNVS